ncbi:P-loop containing nucleoside triphosphate hydrolase protein, partial [Lindgomyces ingoldianus]
SFQFIDGEYPESHEPTTKEEQFAKPVTLRTRTYTLKITDIGSEDTCRDETIREANGFILVYDICDPSTFEKIPQLYKKIRKVKAPVEDGNLSTTSPTPALPAIVMARNKLDMFNKRKVSREKAEKEAKRLNCGYTEVTAK